MGNADLRDLAVIHERSLDDISGSTVAVDAHNWLYKYLTTTVRFTREEAYTTPDGETVPNLIGIVQGLPKFLEYDITPVFVFDGEPPALKQEELEARRRGKEEAEQRREEALAEGDRVEAAKQESRSQRLTPTILDTSRKLLDLLDAPVIEAPSEAEAQCARMARTDDGVDYAGSDDYDSLLYGAPLTARDLTSSGEVEVMDFAATRDEYGIDREQLVDIAILCGTDYNDGVSGYGPKTALDAVIENGDLWGVIDAEDVEVENAERVRELLLDPDVVGPDGYEYNSDVSPNLGDAREFVLDEWGVDDEEVERGFERIEDAVSQTGLDRWT